MISASELAKVMADLPVDLDHEDLARAIVSALRKRHIKMCPPDALTVQASVEHIFDCMEDGDELTLLKASFKDEAICIVQACGRKAHNDSNDFQASSALVNLAGKVNL